MSFVHLHLHTQYSLLDGANKIRELLPKVHGAGMPACAITDHGNMFGAVQFYQEAVRQGVKPIIGCEVYVAPQSRHDKVGRIDDYEAGGNYHLILLAMNRDGYRNLCRLVTRRLSRGVPLQAAHRQGAAARPERRHHRAVGVPARRGGAQPHDRPAGEGTLGGRGAGGDIRRPVLHRDTGQQARQAGEGERRAEGAGTNARSAAGRHQRLPLPLPARRRRARGAPLHPDRQDVLRSEALEVRDRPALREGFGGDGGRLRRRARGGVEHPRHRAALRPGAQAGVPLPRVPGAAGPHARAGTGGRAHAPASTSD